MAGLLYLPRLFVYHAKSTVKSHESEIFKTMERRLLNSIMHPAMVAAWLTGSAIGYGYGELQSTWLHLKIILVITLTGVHAYLARQVRIFAMDANRRSSQFYRVLNEVPTVLMILIVILVVVKPI
jgi:putative membrane protein